MNKDIVAIGDTVVWRGSFGTAAPVNAVVVSMEITHEPRAKAGIPTAQAFWKDVRDNRVLFTLDNGKWAYGEQITPA